MRYTAVILLCALLMGGCGTLRDSYNKSEVLIVDGCVIHIKGMKIDTASELQNWDFDKDCEVVVRELE